MFNYNNPQVLTAFGDLSLYAFILPILQTYRLFPA